MKRLLLLFLSLLMLCGCGSPEEPVIPVTEAPTVVTEAPTEPTGLHEPGHVLETLTGGALKVYPLDQVSVQGMMPLGSDLVIFSGDGNTATLTKLCGEQLYEAACQTLDCAVFPEDAAVQVSQKGITYYDRSANDLVFLDTGLEEVSRVRLPYQIIGQPALSADRKSLYYLTADSLREMDLELGIDRLIRQMSFPEQSITGLHWDDTILECRVCDENGNRSQLFLGVATGELVAQTSGDLNLTTGAGFYFVRHMDGAYPEKLIGTGDDEILMLHTPDYGAEAHPIPDQSAIVTITYTPGAPQLDYYSLEDGSRPYSLVLPAETMVKTVVSHPDGDSLWLLLWGSAWNGDVVCRWNLRESAVSDDTVYIGLRRTPENPDTQGLEECAALAAQLSRKHGVEILTWTAATAVSSPDYALVSEHQVAIVTHYLNELDRALSRYPAGMLSQAASELGDGTLRIALVRAINGISGADALNSAPGMQFLDEQTGNPYVILRAAPGMQQQLHHELFHVIESRIFSLSQALDDWEKLNPEDFRYDYSYLYYETRQDQQWIEGEDRAFVDYYSMTFPMEDRARVMEYAMMKDSDACFASETMQGKLTALCRGIREAYDLKQYPDPLPWEHYLKNPITPAK